MPLLLKGLALSVPLVLAADHLQLQAFFLVLVLAARRVCVPELETSGSLPLQRVSGMALESACPEPHGLPGLKMRGV